jgi:hypothetical protein
MDVSEEADAADLKKSLDRKPILLERLPNAICQH